MNKQKIRQRFDLIGLLMYFIAFLSFWLAISLPVVDVEENLLIVILFLFLIFFGFVSFLLLATIHLIDFNSKKYDM